MHSFFKQVKRAMFDPSAGTDRFSLGERRTPQLDSARLRDPPEGLPEDPPDLTGDPAKDAAALQSLFGAPRNGDGDIASEHKESHIGRGGRHSDPGREASRPGAGHEGRASGRRRRQDGARHSRSARRIRRIARDERLARPQDHPLREFSYRIRSIARVLPNESRCHLFIRSCERKARRRSEA